MISFHQKLITLRKELGYQDSDEGCCATYSEKGIDYSLLGEKGWEAFKRRRDFIEKHYKRLPELIQQVESVQVNRDKKTEKVSPPAVDLVLKQVSKVAKFLERGNYYAEPNAYNIPVNSHNSLEISKYAQSEKLQKLGGRAQLAFFTGSYKRVELEKYMELLNKYVSKNPYDISASFAIDNHRVSLCYSSAKKIWTLVDANNPDFPPISSTDVDLPAKLASQIFEAFDDINTEVTVFTSRLFSTGRDEKHTRPLIDTLMKSSEFTSLHQITSSRLIQVNEKNISLVWLAVKQGDIATLQRVMESKVDVDWSEKHAQGLLHLAAENGDIKTLQLLAQLRKPNGSPVIDFNMSDNDGCSPFMYAVQHGWPTVVSFLLSLKKMDGTRLIDKEQYRFGYSYAHFAADNGDVESLKLLDENGFSLESENKDVTPCKLAEDNGHGNVVDFFKARKNYHVLLAEVNAVYTDEKYQAKRTNILELKQQIVNAYKRDHRVFLDENLFKANVEKIRNLSQVSVPKSAPNHAALFTSSHSKKRKHQDIYLGPTIGQAT